MVMVFAMGFLTAALLSLLVLPALSRRAERLARRRIEARLPLSLAEISAERDQLRAELAVEARKVEIRLEEARRVRAEELGELGRRAIMIADLQRVMSEKSAVISGLEADVARLDGTLDETRASLAESHADLLRLSGELAQRGGELSDLRAAHADLTALAEERRTLVASLETKVEALDVRAQDMDRDVAEARREAEGRLATIRSLETDIELLNQRVVALQQERDGLDFDLDGVRTESAEAAARLATLAAESGERQRRLAVERQRADAAEAALADARRRIDTLVSHTAELEEDLQSVRAERKALKLEFDRLQKAVEAAGSSQTVENEQLREEMDRLAAEILKLAATGDTVAAASAGTAPKPERRRSRIAAVQDPTSPAASR